MPLIFVLFSISRYPEILPRVFNLDKFLHTLEYDMPGCLFMRVLVTSPRTVFTGAPAVFTIVFGTMYAIRDEWHRSFVPGRYASTHDILSDIIGVALVPILSGFVRRRAAWM